MFCSKCGKNIHDEALICPECGYATVNYTMDKQKQPQKQDNMKQADRMKPVGGGIKTVAYALLLLSVLVGFIGGALFGNAFPNSQLSGVKTVYIVIAVVTFIGSLYALFFYALGAIISELREIKVEMVNNTEEIADLRKQLRTKGPALENTDTID